MRRYRDALGVYGHEVTSRWIDMHGGKYPGSFTPQQLADDPEYCNVLGEHDLEDIRAADIMMSFTSPDNGGKGGRHVEFGYALALKKHLVIVGPRENVFHTNPRIEWYAEWGDLLVAWFAAMHPEVEVPT
jgi:nucleoside 2-deoxyribosyltransferase